MNLTIGELKFTNPIMNLLPKNEKTIFFFQYGIMSLNSLILNFTTEIIFPFILK
jgi:hypothetical protein